VFCLLTALRIHDLTTQAPFGVWIAIGNKDHPPRLDYPPLRTVRFSDGGGGDLFFLPGAVHVPCQRILLQAAVPAT